jgi:hypothetical protein
MGGLELIGAAGAAGRPAANASKLLEGESHFASASAMAGHSRPPLVLAMALGQEVFLVSKSLKNKDCVNEESEKRETK